MKRQWWMLLLPLLALACLCQLLGVEPLEVGTTAPDFALPSVDGEDVSLSDFAGQIVLLNFWSAG